MAAEENLAAAAASEKCLTPRRTRKSILSFPANVQRPMQQDNMKAAAKLSCNPPTNTGKEKAEGSRTSMVSIQSTNPETLPGSMPPAARPIVVAAGPPPASSTGMGMTQGSGHLVVKDVAAKDATAAVATSTQDGLLKEKDTMPAVSVLSTKLLPDVPGGKATQQRQPLMNVNSDQAMKRKDENKGRKSILSFPPDSGVSLHPYTHKKAKFEDDLAQNPQPSNADPNDCKAQ